MPLTRTCRSSGCQGKSREHAGLAASSSPLREAVLVKNRKPAASTPLSRTIRDDGRGIRPEDMEKAESLGLIGMRERAELLGGTLDIGHAPLGGVLVTARIPLKEHE